MSRNIARSRSRVRLVRNASTAGSGIGRGSRIGVRTEATLRTGRCRLALPMNGWCRSGTRARAGSSQTWNGDSPRTYSSAAIAQSKKLDAPASTRLTVAGESSVPGIDGPPATTDSPSRCAARLLGSRRK